MPAPPLASQVVAPEVTVSAEDCDEIDVQAAYSPLHDDYLVVWNEICASGTPAARILGCRLDRWGRPSGDVFEVAPTSDGHHRTHPTVAFDPVADRDLVAYAFANDGSDLDIRARFLRWFGVVAGWDERLVAQANESEWNPDVAFSVATGKYLR